MTCVHLQRLYQVCQDEQVTLSSSDLVHLVCHQCGKQEVCPSTLTDEYDQMEPDEAEDSATDATK